MIFFQKREELPGRVIATPAELRQAPETFRLDLDGAHAMTQTARARKGLVILNGVVNNDPAWLLPSARKSTEVRMRLIAGVAVLCLAGIPAIAQEPGARLRQPRGQPQAPKAEPKPEETGAIACTATHVRVSNLSSERSLPVALPPLYARAFSGACTDAEKRAKAIPSQDTNYVILGRTTPVEMAAGLCQSGAGNRTFPRSDLKPSRGGFIKPATRDVKESVTITKTNKYTLTGTGSGFSYTLSGTCTVMQPGT